MGDAETLRKAAEILDREHSGVTASLAAVTARELADRLDRPDLDEELARVLESAYCSATGDEDVWVRTARAAREHLEGKATDSYLVGMSVEPPVGSVVRDREGRQWRRYCDQEWVQEVEGKSRREAFASWDGLDDRFGPLSLVSEPGCPMSDIVARAREALDGITPGQRGFQHFSGEWWQIFANGRSLARVATQQDARLLIQAPALLRDLVAEVKRLRVRVDEEEASKRLFSENAKNLMAERDKARTEVGLLRKARDREVKARWRDQDTIARVRAMGDRWESAKPSNGGLNPDEANAWNLAGIHIRRALDGDS